MPYKILIIGVDESYNSFIENKTAGLDVELTVSESVDTATELLNDGTIDVVFINDLTIDEFFPITIQMLKATISPPAVLVTGEGAPETVETAVKSGCSAYIVHDNFVNDFRKQLNLLQKNRGSDIPLSEIIEHSPIKHSYKKPKIVVVDDSALLRKLTKKMLPDENYEVITAENGRDCLEKLDSFAPDVILTDIVMPEMDGIELCKTIKTSRRYKHIPVLLMSTESEIGRKITGFSVGAADYLTKPFEEEELRARISTHFLQKQLVSDLKIENTKRKQAEEELQDYTNKLEDIVQERTKEIKTSNELLVKEISERKVIQSELEQNQKKYRELVETVNEWIWEVSSQNIIIYSSPQVFDILGYTPEEIIGKSRAELMSRDEAKRLTSFISKNEKQPEKLKSFRHICEHKDKSKVYIDSSIVPFYDEENTLLGFRGVSRDISFIRKSQKEKERLEHQLHHSEKMAAIGQLAAGVAHEINNPIGFVNSNLHTLEEYQEDIGELLEKQAAMLSLLKDSNLDDSGREVVAAFSQEAKDLDIGFILSDAGELINDCKEGVNRVKDIVMSLKNYAHPGEKKKSYADINSNIDSTLAIVWNELKYHTEIVKNYGDIPEVSCNIQELNQVFMNLLVNAGQAIEKHGIITITTRSVGRDSVEIKISDTGSGIPDEIKNKIFDPFFTTKDVGKGTGLGLNLSYNIITKHGGTIEIDSEVGKGTTFTITLDAHSDNDESGEKESNE